MHAYCLIPAAGTSRSRVRGPQEMDQPPALKTRRSNAVHTRRLALHLSLLERHMAALETERARAVRQLHQELHHLHVPRRLPEISPRNALVAGHFQRDLDTEQQEYRLPSLTLSSSVPVCENDVMVSESVHQTCATNEGLLPVTTHLHPVLKNKDNSGVQQHEDSSKQPDSSPNLKKSTRSELASLAPETSGRKGKVHLRRAGGSTSSSTKVPYTVGLPFKTTIIPRSSRSLPPSGQYRGFGQNVFSNDRYKKTESYKNSQNERDTLKTHPPDIQQNETTCLPQIPGDSQPTDTHTMKIGQQTPQPSQHLETVADPASQTPASPAYTESSPSSHTVDVPQLSSSDATSRSVEGLYKLEKQCHLGGILRDRCSYFPCMEPPTYHSLGFHPDQSTHTWRHWLRQNACRPHHRLAPGRPPPAGLDGRRTPADAPGYVRRKRLGKEELVRLDMARKKYMHALARPPSWNTNYGQPTPYKRLKYQARLKPLL